MYVFKLEFSADICPKVGLQDHMAALFLLFKGTSIPFSIASPGLIYIPANSVGGFSFGTLNEHQDHSDPVSLGGCLSAVLPDARGTFLSQAFGRQAAASHSWPPFPVIPQWLSENTFHIFLISCASGWPPLWPWLMAQPLAGILWGQHPRCTGEGREARFTKSSLGWSLAVFFFLCGLCK